MDPRLAKTVQIVIAVVTAIAGAGPVVSSLAGLVPPTWLANASHAVTLCGALVLWVSQSPALSPWLQTRPAGAFRSSPTCPSCGASVAQKDRS